MNLSEATFSWLRVRALVRKEALRYRVLWGPLVVVGALIALAILISLSARLGMLPGQSTLPARQCVILHRAGCPWAEYLKLHPPENIQMIVRFEVQTEFPNRLPLAPGTMAVVLTSPLTDTAAVGSAAGTIPWRARFWVLPEALGMTHRYRDWFDLQTNAFMRTLPGWTPTSPQWHEDAKTAISPNLMSTMIPFFITAMAVFGIFLCAFSLYTSSISEEREKRILLAILLTPTTPTEMLMAKSLFHGGGAILVASAVVATFKPSLFLNPLFWLTLILGVIGYLAIGTFVVSVVRRSSTMSTVPMLYLVSTSIIILLGGFIPPLALFQVLLLEKYLYDLFYQLLSDQVSPYIFWYELGLASVVATWTTLSLWLFNRRGLAVSHGA